MAHLGQSSPGSEDGDGDSQALQKAGGIELKVLLCVAGAQQAQQQWSGSAAASVGSVSRLGTSPVGTRSWHSDFSQARPWAGCRARPQRGNSTGLTLCFLASVLWGIHFFLYIWQIWRIFCL